MMIVDVNSGVFQRALLLSYIFKGHCAEKPKIAVSVKSLCFFVIFVLSFSCFRYILSDYDNNGNEKDNDNGDHLKTNPK